MAILLLSSSLEPWAFWVLLAGSIIGWCLLFDRLVQRVMAGGALAGLALWFFPSIAYNYGCQWWWLFYCEDLPWWGS